MVEKHVYNTILSLLFSPCKHYLVAGNIYGGIGVYLMKDILSNAGDDILDTDRLPKRVISTPNNEKVCSLAATKQFLIAGTVGEIFAWDWTALPKKGLKISWSIDIPCQRESQMKVDVNSLAVLEDSSSYLFAGCGDNKVYMFSLEDGREIRVLEGHTDYIHCITTYKNEVGSCGEDGEVKLWDPRKATQVATLTPSSNDLVNRPHLGKWISDMDFNETRLVCGGGPKGSLWDTRSLKRARALEGSDTGVHVAKIWSKVVTAGISDTASFFDLRSSVAASSMQSSSTAIYTAASISDNSQQVIAFAGASNFIDICRNFKTRTTVLSFN